MILCFFIFNIICIIVDYRFLEDAGRKANSATRDPMLKMQGNHKKNVNL